MIFISDKPCDCPSCAMARKMAFAMAKWTEDQILRGYVPPTETTEVVDGPR